MKPKVIIIHGLNNTLESVFPLRESLQSMGHECVLINLPGHGKSRDKTLHFDSAQREFDQSIKPHTTEPYVVVAFSLGALYLQLWLENNEAPRPLAQVLLAPALKIRHQELVHLVMGRLSPSVPLPSQTPPQLRLYPFLYVRDYDPLLKGQSAFERLSSPFPIPSLILVDPKDEVIDVHGLKKKVDEVNLSSVVFELVERKYLKGRRPGKYHVLIHPDFFRPGDWDQFVEKMSKFLSAN